MMEERNSRVAGRGADSRGCRRRRKENLIWLLSPKISYSGSKLRALHTLRAIRGFPEQVAPAYGVRGACSRCRCRYTVWRTKTIFLIALIAVLGLASLKPMCAAEPSAAVQSLPAPKHVVAPRLHGRVKVDGELKERVWAKAAVLEPFYHNDGSGPEREHTQVRLWYDQSALYLAWMCQDRDIQATYTNRDSKFWEEEVVEFFIAPKELKRYFELQWNPLGGVFDAIIENDLDELGVSKAMHGDWSYTAKEMRSAVRVKGTVNNSSDKDEFWQVEVRLPFCDLGELSPQPK